jgi:hypothetical protein
VRQRPPGRQRGCVPTAGALHSRMTGREDRAMT